jgi:hypothetical protein
MSTSIVSADIAASLGLRLGAVEAGRPGGRRFRPAPDH